MEKERREKETSMMEVMVLMMRLYTFRYEYGINRFISNSLMHLMDSKLWVRAKGGKAT